MRISETVIVWLSSHFLLLTLCGSALGDSRLDFSVNLKFLEGTRAILQANGNVYALRLDFSDVNVRYVSAAETFSIDANSKTMLAAVRHGNDSTLTLFDCSSDDNVNIMIQGAWHGHIFDIAPTHDPRYPFCISTMKKDERRSEESLLSWARTTSGTTSPREFTESPMVGLGEIAGITTNICFGLDPDRMYAASVLFSNQGLQKHPEISRSGFKTSSR